MGFLRRRRRHQHRSRDGYQPRRCQIHLALAGSTAWYWSGAFIGRRADENCKPRPRSAASPNATRDNFEARAVRRLRSAHGAALSVRTVRLLRRPSAAGLYVLIYENRSPSTPCRRGKSAKRTARGLYRRRGRLLRAYPRHHRGGAAAERRPACSAMPGCSMFGILFIVMVMYAPGGLIGLLFMHMPIWRAPGGCANLLLPYGAGIPRRR